MRAHVLLPTSVWTDQHQHPHPDLGGSPFRKPSAEEEGGADVGLFSHGPGDLRRERETRLRPFLRSRAERLSDGSGLKATDYEIAAALMVSDGNIALAHRLLVAATGTSLGPRYVATRVKRSPKLKEFANNLRLKNAYWAKRGICPACGEVLLKGERS